MGSVIQRTLSNEILDKTMYVFWERGYFNTSVDDLVVATGFNKSAIYKYFGGKHELFIAMLKRYRDVVTPRLTTPLKETHRGLQAIDNFFSQFLALNKSDTPCGCFLIATASELPSHDKEVSVFIQQFSRDLKQLLLGCLVTAQQSKQLNTDVNINAIADFLMVNVFGLMTLHRTSVEPSVIKHHIIIVKHYLQEIEFQGENHESITSM